MNDPKDASEIERETKALYATLTDAEKETLGWADPRGTRSLSWALAPGSRDTLAFDIRPTLRQVHCPVLALNEGKDCRVPPKENHRGNDISPGIDGR
jgi:pimeloyl-ACP methyl ester carboxylesterase